MQLPFRHLCLTILAASPALAGPMVPDFDFRATEKQMRLSDARGEFAVIHYLPTLDATALTYLAEVSRNRDRLAGVMHIVVNGAADSARAESTLLQEGDLRFVLTADTDGKITRALAIHGAPEAPPAIIIVDPTGSEVFRRVGKSAGNYMTAGELFTQFDQLSTASAASEYNLRGGEPAIKGYDPVSYFDSSSATMGHATLTSRYRGVTYQFSSVENRRKFADRPRNFVPSYGGWCATAMAEGDKVDVDPANFKVTNGRLFLFYKGWLGNARKGWDKNEAALTRKADEHWYRIAPAESSAITK